MATPNPVTMDVDDPVVPVSDNVDIENYRRAHQSGSSFTHIGTILDLLIRRSVSLCFRKLRPSGLNILHDESYSPVVTSSYLYITLSCMPINFHIAVIFENYNPFRSVLVPIFVESLSVCFCA